MAHIFSFFHISMYSFPPITLIGLREPARSVCAHSTMQEIRQTTYKSSCLTYSSIKGLQTYAYTHTFCYKH